MNSNIPTPVSGGGHDKGKPDGVNDPGRSNGGDSAGGAYQNPHSGKDGNSDANGFFGHGGQTEIAYHGGGQAGGAGLGTPNATTEGSDDASGKGATGPKPGPTGPDQDLSAEYPRETTIDGKKIKIIDTSGVAAAEAAGTTGTDGKPNATEHPGSG